MIAALKWNKCPRDLTKIPQVHVGGDDEGEGEVELLVRHSAVLRPVEVTGEAALVDGVLEGSLTVTGKVMRSSYIPHRIRSAHSRLESLNTTLFLQCCTVCRDVAFCQQISENLMRNLLKLTEITSLRFSDELRALCLLQLDGMVGQPSLMTGLISLTIKVEERNQDEQQDVRPLPHCEVLYQEQNVVLCTGVESNQSEIS